jgi:putative heme iron utilization protein
MALQPKTAKKLSTTNTKQEMLDTYNDLLTQLEDKREAVATPEQKVVEKATKQVIAVADALTADTIISEINCW